MSHARIFQYFAVIALSALTLPRPARATGPDLDPNEIRGTSTKKPVAVLQNRYFLKAWRPEVAILYGTMLNEAYTNTKLRGLRFSLFFNEWVGAEYQWIRTSVSDSDDRKALNRLQYRPVTADPKKPNEIVSPDAEVNAISGMTDISVIAAPFYGKLNIMDATIIYSDVYGSLGISRVDTDQGTLNAFTYGVGQRFYWAERWSSRIDFRNRSYVEQRGGSDTRKYAWSVDFGVSYFFR